MGEDLGHNGGQEDGEEEVGGLINSDGEDVGWDPSHLSKWRQVICPYWLPIPYIVHYFTLRYIQNGTLFPT